MKNTETNDSLWPFLFAHRQEGVLLASPVNGEAGISGFRVSYCNRSGALLLNLPHSGPPEEGLPAGHGLPQVPGYAPFEHLLHVWQTGDPYEHPYHNPEENRHLLFQYSKVPGGVMLYVHDRTEEVRREREQQEQQRKFREVIDLSADGVLMLDAVRDGEGNIIDFRIAYCNKAGITMGQLPPDAISKTLLQVFPHLHGHSQFALHRQVVETGEPRLFETTFRSPKSEEFGWFIVTLSKQGDGVVSRFTDITRRRQHEQQIEKQKDELNSIFDASLSAIMSFGTVRNEQGTITDLKYLRVNRMFLQMLGKTEEEIRHATMLQLYPTARSTEIFANYCLVIKTGVSMRFQVHYNGEGLNAWFDISCVKTGDETAVATFNDITEQKNAIDRIEAQRNLLDNILRHSSSGISVTEVIRNEDGEVVDGRTILANEAAERYTGIPEAVFREKTIREFDPVLFESPVFRMALRTLETGIPMHTQYFFAPNNKWLELSVSRMDEHHLINLFTDITASMEAKLLQEKLFTELQRSNANLEEFAYVASHDLQEPLRKIYFFAERLKKELAPLVPEESLKMFERLESAAARMRELIDDLLTYSKVSVKPDVFEHVSLNDLVNAVLTDMEATIVETGARVTAGKLPRIRGDARQLRQMLQNILSNAIKYRKSDTTPHVTLSCRMVPDTDPLLEAFAQKEKTNYYCIEITDNGIGFEQEHAEKIFQVFQRLHGRTEYEGTGIGLAIVLKVVINHKGYITAESELGAGATFRIFLPE